MSRFRLNQIFVALMALGLLGALGIPQSITDRAKGKADRLLIPVVKPVRAIAGLFHSKYGDKSLPPGEKAPRSDADLLAENTGLREQVVFLLRQYDALVLVEAELKKLGPLLQYFKPVAVLGNDATPGRDSLGIAAESGVDFTPETPVMWSEGLAGTIVEGRRVRLITDKGAKITGTFGRWEDGQWIPLSAISKASVIGIGGGAMRVDHLFLKDTAELKEGDWVMVAGDADGNYGKLIQGRQIGQVESIRPLPAKPLFAEIIIKPRTDLRKLRSVLVPRK